MKKALVVIAVLALAASLGAQNLAELAKKEKARRESLKVPHAVVITNAGLLRVKKLPGVEITPPETESGEAAEAEAQGFEPATVPDEGEAANLPSGSGAPQNRRIVPSVAPNGPLIMGDPDRDQAEVGGTLDARLKAANELVDLLTTKMNSLRQQIENQDAMVPSYVIQQQLDETNQRLLKAQAQQARIEAQIGKGAAAKKTPGRTCP
jgi:hypothetical protein